MPNLDIDILFKDDIAHLLQAANQTAAAYMLALQTEIENQRMSSGIVTPSAQEISDRMELFDHSFRSALGAVAVAAGITPVEE